VSFAQEYESPLVVEKQLKDAADAIETSILKLQKKISEASSSGAKTNHSEISRMVERISKISRQFGNMLKTVPEVYEDYGMAIKTTCDIYKTLFDFYGIKTYTDHWMTFIWNWYDV
jgi:hypothetical protein